MVDSPTKETKNSESLCSYAHPHEILLARRVSLIERMKTSTEYARSN